MSKQHTTLTASEVAGLWTGYMNNSMSSCVLKYFLQCTDDSEIKSVIKFALHISDENLQTISKIMKKENYAIPVGFTDHDVNLNAPRLYSDSFYLYYLKNMAKVGMSIYGVALATMARSDMRKLITWNIEKSTELYNKIADVLLDKGLFIRPPHISTEGTIDFISDKTYFSGFLSKRHLNVIEITHLAANLEANAIGQNLLSGLGQVARSDAVRDNMFRGKEISKKHVKVFQTNLMESDLPAPVEWDLAITDSTIAPFSDKLMMFHIGVLISSSISNYATAAAASFRTDIVADYARLSAEVAKYSKDSIDIMVKQAWLEEPPQAIDHEKLAK